MELNRISLLAAEQGNNIAHVLQFGTDLLKCFALQLSRLDHNNWRGWKYVFDRPGPFAYMRTDIDDAVRPEAAIT